MLQDYDMEAKRLQVLNQRYGFLLNAVQYVKIRQAGAPGDLKWDIMEKKITAELDSLINREVSFNDVTPPAKPPVTPTKLGLV